jgi:hypothetical protein
VQLGGKRLDTRIDAALVEAIAAQLQRRGDVVGHGHRRVVDELLVDHRDIAVTHRHTGDVAPIDQHAPGARRVEPGHHAHQRGLAGLRRAEEHGHGTRHQAQVQRIQQALRALPLFDVFKRQLHGVSACSE